MDLNLVKMRRAKTIDPMDIDPFQRKSTIIPPTTFYTLYILTRKLVPLMQSYVRSYVHAHVRTHVGRTHTRRF